MEDAAAAAEDSISTNTAAEPETQPLPLTITTATIGAPAVVAPAVGPTTPTGITITTINSIITRNRRNSSSITPANNSSSTRS